MSKMIRNSFRSLLVALVFVLSFGGSARASHIVGGDLFYTWITGNTYRITLMLYGDCGPASSGAFATLSRTDARPQICIYDGAAPLPGMPFLLDTASPRVGTEITPICPDSLVLSQCVSTSNPIPGIKRFVYSGVYTLPYASANWRFVFNSNYGPSSAGRAAAITNIVGAGGTLMELTATLNNTVYNNTSPNLTVVPTPFFCINQPTCYTPGAIDAEGDSLRFVLSPAINTTAASGSCALGTPVTYTGTAFGTTPVSATTPLRCAAGTYSFSSVNGQICFTPNFLQRSIVVYTVNEYRDGQFVGSCQREMTFLVQNCASLPPVRDSVPDRTGVVEIDGPTNFHICGDEGAFSIILEPRGSRPEYRVTATATGLPAGMTFSVTGNGTNTPICTFSGNASTMTPGVYTFFLNLKDDACPLNGVTNTAYTLTIFPVPTISTAIVSEADCINRAVVRVTPGGTGSPWTIKVSDPNLTAPADTIGSYTASAPFDVYLEPGPLPGPNQYNFTIYTNVSTECALWDSVRLRVPERLTPSTLVRDPSHCGKNDGAIIIGELNRGGIDTIEYNYNGVPQTPIIGVVDTAGTMTIPNLRAGVYSNFVVRYGYCTSLPFGRDTLVDPPFTFRAVTSTNPTKCGFCDGTIKLLGLHPDQLDTVTFTKDGVPQAPISYYVTSDSTIILPAMCEGVYTPFTVKTAGVCQRTLTSVATLTAPPIGAIFDTAINYGCKGDTVFFFNSSFPASDLTYQWDFGDGGTSTEINPVHVYTNTVGASYVVKLYATNTRCLEVDSLTINLNHYVDASFTQAPEEFVCQTDPVLFTNTSTGTGVDYMWYFGDGTTDAIASPTHTYTNMGTYNTILVAHNVTEGVHCYDTAIRSVVVDSNSLLSIQVSNDVKAICRGQAVTFTAIYTESGQQSNAWNITDGFAMTNINPLMHAFEETGPVTINFDAKFRACPEKTSNVNLYVFDVPSLYLGVDTAICEGSNPIILKDERNAGNARARWRWNTEEVGPSITVKKAGTYAVTVTIDGCSTTDSIEIAKDCYVTVPNIFTPNGDGVNDYFFPRSLMSKSLKTFYMSIYNRWGQKIYETKLTDGRGWDGNMNGVPQPAGVYVYSIEAEFGDGQVETHNGNVTLLR